MSSAVSLAARIVLAAVLALAATHKLRAGVAATARAFTRSGVSPRWSQVVAVMTPVAEAAVAASLVVLRTSPAPGVAAAMLLVAFTVFLVAIADRAQPCPCFGMASDAPVTGRTVLRNGVLIAVAALATGDARDPRLVASVVACGVLGAMVALVLRWSEGAPISGNAGA